LGIFIVIISAVVAPPRFLTEAVSTHAWHSGSGRQRHSWSKGWCEFWRFSKLISL